VNALNILVELLGGLAWLEEHLRAPQSLFSQNKRLVSRQEILALDVALVSSSLDLSIIILGHNAHALLDISHNFHGIGRVLYEMRVLLLENLVHKLS